MFIISKIVRGRRLLHEMEEDTKENLTKKQNQKKKETSTAHDASPNTSNETPELLQRVFSRRKTWSMTDQDISGSKLPHVLLNRKLTPRRCGSEKFFKKLGDYGIIRKTTRQKTETSLPADEVTDSSHLDTRTRIRRTSSMPSVCDELYKYPSETKILRHYNYDQRLSKLQKRALRFTWQRLQTRNGGKRIETVFEEVFDKMMKQMPLMREIFTTRTFLSAMSKEGVSTLRDHSRMTVKMIDLVIKNLDVDPRKRTDTETDYDPRILGKVHACLRPYGFNSNFWEKLGEIFIDVVLVQEAVRDLPGAGQSWVILTACLVDQLRAGFDQAKDSITSSKQSIGNHVSSTCPAFRNDSQERRKSCHPLDITHIDDDEHVYVNFPPIDSKTGSPMHSSPQTGSPLHHHTPRQLPEVPVTSFDAKPSFSLSTENSIDPIR